ncbi:DUF917 domain-containing protein [Niveispirillum cyanobacteriorum]|uniref:DUF917 domain-containing protein n=1 Tax=Niveispirillum cyanobacteriorum TaxID=1612173 RepID=A0A2K9NJZ4_9PROT|nr:DUF917 domain-containing protein [Niveispirillum cyanobacteriorum]AUN32655.1 DUF917 domain-containing protein [Niveispirillum cyanobacteriorum]GGE83025.1 hypothetical protein GCM10011317_45300 [Niveispirillum cyanobacteriorum]
MRIDRTALADLARGAAFLGSGGGGDPYYGLLLAEAALERTGGFDLISPSDLADDALVAPCGWIGAPTVSVEKLPNGGETVAGLRRLEQIMGRRIDAVLPVEIGGGNGLAPFIAAAELGVPVVDCDGMGRAFPESQMVIFNVRGVSACPSVLTAACGSLAVIETDNNLTHERIARGLSVALGGIAHMVEYPLTGTQAKHQSIPGSVSAAIAIGAAIRTARTERRDPFEALATALRATGLYPHCLTLFDGKITDLERETRGGFSIGKVVIDGFGGDGQMEVLFQNENLVARLNSEVRAMVPDLITIMDRETADTITTERLKYGQRVKVIAASAPSMLREPAALALMGPGAFGFDPAFTPIETLNNIEGA